MWYGVVICERVRDVDRIRERLQLSVLVDNSFRDIEFDFVFKWDGDNIDVRFCVAVTVELDDADIDSEQFLQRVRNCFGFRVCVNVVDIERISERLQLSVLVDNSFRDIEFDFVFKWDGDSIDVRFCVAVTVELDDADIDSEQFLQRVRNCLCFRIRVDITVSDCVGKPAQLIVVLSEFVSH